MKYQLVIFDWQGTLTNVTLQFAQQFCNTAETLGLPKVEISEVIELMHLDICYLIQTLYPNAACQTQRSAMLHHFNLHRLHHHHHVCLYPGVKTLLQQLRENDVYIGIATAASSATLTAELTYAKLMDCVDAYKTPDHTLCKPAPDMLNELIDEFGCSQKNTVMIGDSRCDFDAAANAGVDFIGLHLRSDAICQDVINSGGKVAFEISELLPLLN